MMVIAMIETEVTHSIRVDGGRCEFTWCRCIVMLSLSTYVQNTTG